MLQNDHSPPSCGTEAATRNVTNGGDQVPEFRTPHSAAASKEFEMSQNCSVRSKQSNTSVLSSSALPKRRKFNGD